MFRENGTQHGKSTTDSDSVLQYSCMVSPCYHYANFITYFSRHFEIWRAVIINNQDLRNILCMRPANEKRRYSVTSSLIGWAHTQTDPWRLCLQKNRSKMFTFKAIWDKIINRFRSCEKVEFMFLWASSWCPWLSIIFYMVKYRGKLYCSYSTHGHLTRYVKLRVAHALGMPGTFTYHRL